MAKNTKPNTFGTDTSRTRRPQITTKTYLPNNQYDEELKRRFFLIMQDNNLNELKNFSQQNNLPLDIKNNEGENLISVIIKNDNTGEIEKLNTIKFLLANGIGPNNLDKNDVTPLHLSAFYNLPLITDLLIKNNANINALDNLGRTPLHYAFLNEYHNCESSVENIFSTNKENATCGSSCNDNDRNYLKNLTLLLIDILGSENFEKYIAHIFNTIKNSDQIYNEQFISYKDQYELNKFNNFMKNSKSITNYENNSMELKKYYDSIYQLLNNNLSTSLSPIIIDTNSSNLLNSNLLYKEFNNKIEYFSQIDKISENYDKIIMQLDSKFEDLFNYKASFDSKITLAYRYIHKIIQLNYALRSNRNIEKINFPDENVFEISFVELKKLILHKDNSKLIFPELNIIGTVDLDKYKDFLPIKNDEIIKTLRINKSKIKKEKADIIAPKYYSLSDDSIGGIVTNVERKIGGRILDTIKPTLFETSPGETRFFLDNTTDVEKYGDVPFYFISKISFFISQINKHINAIYKNFITLGYNIKDNYFYEIFYRIITNINDSIYNIFQNLIMIKKEESYIHETVRALKILINEKLIYKDHPYFFYFEEMRDTINNLGKDLGIIFTDINDFFKSILGVIDLINAYIKNINKKFAMEYSKKFFNEFVEDSTDNIFDIYNQPLPFLKKPSTDLDKYYNEMINLNIDEMRTKIYEKYIPAINNTFKPTYFISKDKSLSPSETFLYLSSSVNLPVLTDPNIIRSDGYYDRIKILKPNINTKPLSGLLTQEPFNIDSNSDTFLTNNKKSLEEIKNYITSTNYAVQDISDGKIDPIVYDGSDSSVKNQLIGKIGFVISDENKFSKRDSAIGSISDYLDYHFTKIKYWLILAIMLLFEDVDLKNNKNEPYLKSDELKKRIIKIKQDGLKKIVSNNSNINKEYIMDRILIVLSDTILINHIKFSIYSYLNNNYEKIYKNYFPNHQIILFSDEGFKFNLNKIYNEIIEKFLTMNVNPSDIDFNNNMFTLNTFKKTNIDCDENNEKIIRILLNSGSNTSIKDYMGNTALIYGIKNKNENINYLIGKDRQLLNLKNNNNLNPREFLLKDFMINSDVNNIKDIFNLISRKFSDNILQLQNYNIKYLDLIIPETILFYNYFFYFSMRSYINNWTFDEQVKIQELLKKKCLSFDYYDTTNINIVPLLKNISQNKNITNIYVDALKDKMKDIEKNIIKNDKKILSINNQIQNYTKELEELKKNNIKPEVLIIYENNIKNLEKRKENYNNENKNLEKNKLEENIINKNEQILKKTKNKIDNFILKNQISDTNISGYYNKMFEDLIDDNSSYNGYIDYIYYNELWEDLVKNETKLKDIQHIHLIIYLLISQSSKINNLGDPKEMEIIIDLYEKIFIPIIKNYEYLPNIYDSNENYVLYEIINIISNISKTIVFSNLYYTLVKFLTEYFIYINPSVVNIFSNKPNETERMIKYENKENYNHYIKETISSSLKNLKEYIINDLPKIVVQNYVLEIKDEDLMNRAYEKIMELILINEAIPIINNSEIISECNKIIDNYRQIANNSIDLMFKTINEYNNEIKQQYLFLKTLAIVDK